MERGKVLSPFAVQILRPCCVSPGLPAWTLRALRMTMLGSVHRFFAGDHKGPHRLNTPSGPTPHLPRPYGMTVLVSVVKTHYRVPTPPHVALFLSGSYCRAGEMVCQISLMESRQPSR